MKTFFHLVYVIFGINLGLLFMQSYSFIFSGIDPMPGFRGGRWLALAGIVALIGFGAFICALNEFEQ